MEILINKLQDSQNNLEYALQMEINYEEVKDTKEGQQLLGYLRKRRRVVNRLVKTLGKI